MPDGAIQIGHLPLTQNLLIHQQKVRIQDGSEELQMVSNFLLGYFG